MPGEPQTLAVPPPVSVQTLIWAIRNAVVNGGGSVNATGDGISVVGSTVTVDASTLRTSLGLGSIATQSASAVAITGGTLAGITGLGVRDTSAAFDVSLVFTSAIPLDAGRAVTVDVGNGNRSFSLWGDFVVPDGGGIAALLGADNSFTGANTFHNAAGLVVRPSGLQDGVALKGRAGGTFSYTAAITTAALTASRAFTIPAVSADDTFALLGIANAFTGANTFTNAAGIVTRAAATQDGVAIVGRAGGTSSYSATITTAALTGNRTFTIPAVTGNDTFAMLGVANVFSGSISFSGAAPPLIQQVASGRLDVYFGGSSKHQFWVDGSYYQNDTAAELKVANRASLFGDASHVLALRSGTNAQTFRVYGTFTDASNYVRAAINTTSTTVVLACETAGTGADNIDLGLTPAGTGLVAFSNAASVDAAVVSTHTARVKFNGTEYKVLLATP